MSKYFIAIFLLIVFIINPGMLSGLVFAQSQNNPVRIAQNTETLRDEIADLEAEIRMYQNQVNQISSQAVTLESTLKSIETNQKQLQSRINLTNRSINQTNQTITKNEIRISQLSQGINTNSAAVEELFRVSHQSTNRNFLELLLSNDSVSSFMNDMASVSKIQSRLKNTVVVMIDIKDELEQAQQDLALENEKLKKLKGDLSDQERIIAIQRQDQSDLVKQTKNQESEFRSLIADRQAKKDALDAEIRSFESQIEFNLDPTVLPKPGSQVLAWPLADVFVTQRFGRTVAAQRLYVSGSHSGTDFRAAVGTPVYAVADGIIEGVGDTDLTCPRASFGKWVFIRHYNGLATAYGHLSLIKAVEGTRVQKGELIGYSGNTGYSTGPHLHLTVYASNGVNGSEGARITERPSNACPGRNYRMPIAPTVAYLDPLLYLPPLAANKFKSGLQ
jgi:murein DD-endopeptidase MepM/ murein hydrolase activator NlpD